MALAKRQLLNTLRELARAYGVQTRYLSMTGAQCQASAESLRAAAAALGAPVDRLEDVPDALRERRLEKWRHHLEPVSVAWGRTPATVEYYPDPAAPERPLEIELTTERGEVIGETLPPERVKTLRVESIGGRDYPVKELRLGRLRPGYHTLRVDGGAGPAEAMLIAAPRRAYEHEASRVEAPTYARMWGAFLPLYALHSRRSWGAGDLGDFERLTDWIQELGGAVTATLPLMASFLDEPFDPSPYVPASRLFWNEFYIDMERIPELEGSAAARALIETEAFQAALRRLREAPETDYRGVMELKARVLGLLAREFFHGHPQPARAAAFERFAREDPKAEDYAAFRAACRARHGSWHGWPEPMKQGRLAAGDYDRDVKGYYLYAQFIAREQLDRLAQRARHPGSADALVRSGIPGTADGLVRSGPGLYLDMPLGVHPDGYDVWRERDSFAWGVSGGSPPDAFFSKGQDWGFAPLHPLALRERRYGYIIECLRRLMRQAGVVRIDHVMGLHRLFWVPRGMEAAHGVYVDYPAEELHAILNVESHRARSAIVGEDLGTVPGAVRRAMKRHNVHGMYVLQFSVEPQAGRLVAPVPPGSVASVNTHDMPSFAGFWRGRDIDDQLDLGLIKPEDEKAARAGRAAVRAALTRFLEREGLLKHDSEEAADALPGPDRIRAALEFLARSPAAIVLVNLEDLWQELRQQNVPGTCAERANWRHKARYALEEITTRPDIRDLLTALNHARG